MSYERMLCIITFLFFFPLFRLSFLFRFVSSLFRDATRSNVSFLARIQPKYKIFSSIDVTFRFCFPVYVMIYLRQGCFEIWLLPLLRTKRERENEWRRKRERMKKGNGIHRYALYRYYYTTDQRYIDAGWRDHDAFSYIELFLLYPFWMYVNYRTRQRNLLFLAYLFLISISLWPVVMKTIVVTRYRPSPPYRLYARFGLISQRWRYLPLVGPNVRHYYWFFTTPLFYDAWSCNDLR